MPGPAPFNSVPVHIVDRVEDSTPYRLRMEKLRAAAERYMQVPFPDVFDFQVRNAGLSDRPADVSTEP